jgi:hypothetical protein
VSRGRTFRDERFLLPSFLGLSVAVGLIFPSFISECGLGGIRKSAPTNRVVAVNSSDFFDMARPNQKQRRARCIFCDRPKVDHQHIWPKWVRKLAGKIPDRTESMKVGGTLEKPIYEHKHRQGNVSTKTARKVCPECNRGWMRDIELNAEEIGVKLVKGESVLLGQKEQLILATFIAQSAMMIDLIGKADDRFHPYDYKYFYEHKKPLPHWYIGIGYYVGVFAVTTDRTTTPFKDGSGNKITVTSISTIMGHLFTATQGMTNESKLGQHPPPEQFAAGPISVNGPHLTPVWPLCQQVILYPPPNHLAITGGFWHGGGLARDLSLRFTNRFAREIMAARRK